MGNYQLLIEKLDAFIRKYYLNQLIRGLLLFLSLIIGFYLFANLFEYQLYFSTTARKLILCSFGIVFATTFYRWILHPLLHYWKLGEQLSHEQAATVIGRHFQSVKDKLLNILQLRQQSHNVYNRDLIEASIDQKIENIRLVPFVGAIDLNENKKYLKYLLPVLLLTAGIFIIAPNIFRESTERLVNPDTVYAKKAPFEFVLQNSNLKVVQFEDLEIHLKTKGKTIPNEVFVNDGGRQYKMEKTAPDQFVYRFTNVQADFNFYFTASDFSSRQYSVAVLKKPLIVNFLTQLYYPGYTGKKNETLKNSGDMIVPAGTEVRWDFEASNTENIKVVLNGQVFSAAKNDEDKFSFEKRILQDLRYVIIVSNAQVPDGDSIAFTISATPDNYPSIQCEQFVDSSNTDYALLSGAVSDDYGLSKLNFVYKVTDEKGVQKAANTKPLPLNGKSISDFNYAFTFQEFNLQPGDKVDYYIEVWDNDGVNGPKSSKSQNYQYAKATEQQMEKQEFQNNKDIKDELSDAQNEVNKLAEQIKEMKEKVLNKNTLTWEDKKAMEDLKTKHEQLTQQLEDIKEKYDQNLNNQNEYKKPDEELLKKQEKIQEMFSDLMTDEMKDLMQQIQDILDKMQQKNAFENLDKMQMSNENMNKELDKMQDLFKQLQLEQKAQDIIDKLNTLSQEQQKLADENQQNNSGQSSDQAKQKQDDLNKKFDDVKENMKQLDQLNKENENKLNLSDNQQQQQDIRQDMQNSSDQLEQNQKQGASQSQQKASQKMKKMAEKMQNDLDQMQMDQNAEDIKLIRQLLKNLVKLSFDQEQLMDDLQATETESPKYVQIMQRQQDLREDSKMIGDSLQSLGKRQFQLQNFISDEMYKLNREMNKSLDNLEERFKSQAQAAQQFVMTSANNLALMLSESLDNLQLQQNQMKQGQPGSGMCKKPGGTGPKPSMQQLQKQLGDQLNQMKQDMQNGKDPQNMSKDFAEAVEKQAAIREALRQLKESMSQQEKENGKIDDLIQKMDDLEKDLALKKLSNETLNRHKEIETRLLEFDKAKREQDYDDQRQSKTAEQILNKMPPGLADFLQKRKATLEIYRSVPPDLKPFYKNLVEKYFQTGN